jgi:molecular chaperone DnaJ
MKDYYKILEVEENATDDEIKKSFRNLSKRYHPDLNPEGAEKFKEINEAYEVLGDQQKRSNYNNQKNNPYGGTPFEAIFSQMFGNRGPNQPRRKQAPDKIVKVSVSPIESYRGSQKNIMYFRDTHCSTCNGTGGDQRICNTCEGSGFIIKTFGTGFMVQQIRTACPSCQGKGYNLISRCYDCQGRGTKSSKNEISINLPVGVDNGQFVKIPDVGDFRGGDYGDLILQIELEPKDGFEKINSDLVYTLYLDLNGINSEKYKIPHPDGELQIPAPKSFDTSKPLRLRGKGYSGGDMYVKLQVKFERTT